MYKDWKKMSMSLMAAAIVFLFTLPAWAQSAQPARDAKTMDKAGYTSRQPERMDMNRPDKDGHYGYWAPSYQNGQYDLGYWTNREGEIPYPHRADSDRVKS
jgi:hypothetical protein